MKLMEIFEQRVAKLAEQDEAMPIEPVQMAEPEDMPAEPMMAEPHEPEEMLGSSIRDQLMMLAAEGELGDMCDVLCLCLQVMTDEQIEEIGSHLGLCEAEAFPADTVVILPDGKEKYIAGVRQPVGGGKEYVCCELDKLKSRGSFENIKGTIKSYMKKLMSDPKARDEKFEKDYNLVSLTRDKLTGAKVKNGFSGF